MAQKPSLPSGTRDFSPEQLYKRNFIFSVLREVFELYGYQPIETPAFEKLSTLTGKYGDEGDQLLFKILNNGSYWEKFNETDFNEFIRLRQKLGEVRRNHEIDDTKDGATIWALLSAENALYSFVNPKIADRGLRYDLTIPFARYVVMNQSNITFPFKRYQIQPVWRADRPQRGRYREFYQCDVDVIGSTSLLNDLELVQIYLEVFERLGIDDITVKINNRKLLYLFEELLGAKDRFIEIVTILDKYDKIGKDGVNKILTEKGLGENVDKLWSIVDSFSSKASNQEKLEALKSLSNNETIIDGIKEMSELLTLIQSSGMDDSKVEFDLLLARGLTYYTGTVFEVFCNEVSIGSIGGGGRYDDLTGVFGLPNVSGVGVSFGMERIFDVMEELQLFDEDIQQHVQVMFVNFGGESLNKALECVRDLRLNFVSAEVYPDEVKMKKQMKYANDKKSFLCRHFG